MSWDLPQPPNWVAWAGLVIAILGVPALLASPARRVWQVLSEMNKALSENAAAKEATAYLNGMVRARDPRRFSVWVSLRSSHAAAMMAVGGVLATCGSICMMIFVALQHPDLDANNVKDALKVVAATFPASLGGQWLIRRARSVRRDVLLEGDIDQLQKCRISDVRLRLKAAGHSDVAIDIRVAALLENGALGLTPRDPFDPTPSAEHKKAAVLEAAKRHVERTLGVTS